MAACQLILALFLLKEPAFNAGSFVFRGVFYYKYAGGSLIHYYYLR